MSSTLLPPVSNVFHWRNHHLCSSPRLRFALRRERLLSSLLRRRGRLDELVDEDTVAELPAPDAVSPADQAADRELLESLSIEL